MNRQKYEWMDRWPNRGKGVCTKPDGTKDWADKITQDTWTEGWMAAYVQLYDFSLLHPFVEVMGNVFRLMNTRSRNHSFARHVWGAGGVRILGIQQGAA